MELLVLATLVLQAGFSIALPAVPAVPAVPKDDRDTTVVIGVVSGAMYEYDHHSGGIRHGVNRSFIGAMDKKIRHLRLHLGPQFDVIDMELRQDSAWTEHSLVVVRRGEHTEELRNVVDPDCHLVGRLTSHHGAITLNRCGRLSGVVHTGDVHYEMEGVEEHGHPEEFSNIKVTIRKGKEEEMLHGLMDPLTVEEEETGDNVEAKTRFRRAFRDPNNKPTAEVGLYLDESFVKYQRLVYGRYRLTDLVQFIVDKWNVVRAIYAQSEEVGYPLTLQVKNVEVWVQNPDYYAEVAPDNSTYEILKAFCVKSPRLPNFDHKMVYTHDTGDHQLGLAFLNGICLPNGKCAWSRSLDNRVKIELHEFGHTMGLDHDNLIGPCTDYPDGHGGFMGWGKNYRFMDCYRRILERRISLPEQQCLYRKDVPDLPVLNKEPRFEE